MEEEKKAFEDYLKPRFDATVIVGPLAIAFGLFIQLALGGFFGIILMVIGGMLLYAGIRDMTELKKSLNAEEASGGLAALLSDFRTAMPIAEGNIRLGERYLYPKRSGKYIAYGDVLQVYQTVHKTNFVEDTRTVTAVVRAGEKTETIALCSLALRGRGDGVLHEVMLHLLARNPNIKLGYK